MQRPDSQAPGRDTRAGGSWYRRVVKPAARRFGKPIERLFKSAVLGALNRIGPNIPGLLRRSGAPPAWGEVPYRLLYLRPDKIGDMILVTGVMRAIVTSHPMMTLDVLGTPGNIQVLDGNPHVRTVIVWRSRRPWTWWKVVRQIRRARYDVVIDGKVRDTSVSTLLLVLASGAPHRIGVTGRGVDPMLTLPVSPAAQSEHYVDRSAALLRAFGLDPAVVGVRPELFLTRTERRDADATWAAVEDAVGNGNARELARPMVLGSGEKDLHGMRPAGPRLLVNVSAGHWQRYWPEDRFVSVIRSALARSEGAPSAIIIVGLPADRARMDRIAQRAGVHAAPTSSVRQVLALVATADIVLTADTSITHVASAFGKAAVVLFRRGEGEVYGPYRTDGRVVRTTQRMLDAVPVEAVAHALNEMLQEHAPDLASAR